MKHCIILALFLLACGSVDHENTHWNPREPNEITLVPSCAGKSVFEFREGILRRIEMDGTQTEIFQFGKSLGVDPQNILHATWETMGRYHALTAVVSKPQDTINYELLVLSDDGELHFHEIISGTTKPKLYMSSEGILAADFGRAKTFIVRSSERIELGLYQPLGRATGNELLVKNHIDSNNLDTKFGWLNIDSLIFRPLSHKPISERVDQIGDQALYISSDRKIVLEKPTQHSTLPAPESYFFNDDIMTEWGVHDAPHNFIVLSKSNHFYRADLRGDLRIEPILIESNFSHEPLANDLRIRVRADGALLATRELPEGLQPVMSTDLGKTWKAIAESIPKRREEFSSELIQRHVNGNVFLIELSVAYGYFLESVQTLGSNGSNALITQGAYHGEVEIAEDGSCAVTLRQFQDLGVFEGPYELVAIDARKHYSLLVADQMSHFKFVR